MPLSKIQLISVACAACAGLSTVGLVLLDPDATDLARMDTLARKTAALARRADPVGTTLDVSPLLQQPIFFMSTGRAPYQARSLVISGIAVSNHRRAALVSIDGAAARWLQVGDQVGDLTVIDVDTTGAKFDTPLGLKVVPISAPPPPLATDDGNDKPYVRPPLAPPGD